MSKQQASVGVLEGDRIIAEFMGSEYNSEKKLFYKGGMFCNTFPNGNHYAKIEQLKYCSSWDWQIPVHVKLISELLKMAELIRYSYLRDKYIACVEAGNIMQGHNYLVEIIQWYNQNKQS